jgi:hypothetical protein
MDPERWDRVCEETAEAHAAIVRALHAFEDALLTAGLSPEKWAEEVRRELEPLIDLLARHGGAAVAPAGLIDMIENLQGHSRAVTEISRTHDTLLSDGRSLLGSLRATAKPEERYSGFRRDAAHLAAAVRKHEAQESDLISETNLRVSGGEA